MRIVDQWTNRNTDFITGEESFRATVIGEIDGSQVCFPVDADWTDQQILDYMTERQAQLLEHNLYKPPRILRKPPQSMHIAALTAVNTPTKKGTVVRKWHGENYTYQGCHVSLQALGAYQSGDLKLYDNAFGPNAPENANSFVLVYFVSENPYDTALEIPVIVDKLVR
jgi:hypothetical protein